ncbi:hypothetical protein [Amycolatopsis sp. CA-230715]|uniref:hypothetical protein n=1 Tax=Amycolatopsis sp. CA-230715 TaxID=2745196 RepID=UPI001C02952D|nr:hypothetical protein [Amycolatopsis sp. CA-230715]QWF81666.1 hypothetical protein HUW46_05099 [Amycolatopsis sp. CA-230715]
MPGEGYIAPPPGTIVGIIPTREGAPTSDANYDSQTHEALHTMVNNKLSPEDIAGRGAVVDNLTNWLADGTREVDKAVTSSQTQWQGQAAQKAHEFFRDTSDWGNETADASNSMAEQFRQQANVATTAKNTMPPPTGFNIDNEFDKARERIENGEIFNASDIYSDLGKRAAEAEAQRQQAVQVMHTLDQGYHQAASTQPSFAPPPTMGGAPAGGGGGIEGMWNPSGGGGGGGGINAPGGGSGGPVPPVSPFTGGGPSIGGGGSQPLPPRAPINPPIAKPPITGPIGGGTVLPGSTPDKGGDTTRSQRPGTSSAGSRVSGGGFRSSPEGSTSGKPGKSGPGSEGKPGQGKAAPGRSTGAGEPNKANAIERGAAAAAGKAGKPGANGMAPGAAGKNKEDDKERKTKYVVNDDPEETFSVLPDRGPDGESIVNPVIGEK